jgi:hypothetical protein
MSASIKTEGRQRQLMTFLTDTQEPKRNGNAKKTSKKENDPLLHM